MSLHHRNPVFSTVILFRDGHWAHAQWASITASATFGHSASPDSVTCWHISARAESPAPGDTGRDLTPTGGGIEGRDWPGGADRYHDREWPPGFWDFCGVG